MTTSSPKLGLVLPSQADPFVTEDLKNNLQKIDASPGSYICTSSTRPVWSTSQAGRKILETDSGLEWWWDGGVWKRLGPIGLLKRNDGTWAYSERTTDFSTSSTDYVKALSLTSVVIPAGTRPIRVYMKWQSAATDDVNSAFLAALFRSNTAASGPQMEHFRIFGTSTGGYGSGGAVFFSDLRDGLAAGSYDFSFQIRKDSGITGAITLKADNVTPISLTVTEL